MGQEGEGTRDKMQNEWGRGETNGEGTRDGEFPNGAGGNETTELFREGGGGEIQNAKKGFKNKTKARTAIKTKYFLVPFDI